MIERLQDVLLLAGGLRVLEVTLRTAAGLPAIETIARHLPESVAGVGTALNSEDARCACEAVARFAVSPGYSRMEAAPARPCTCPCCLHPAVAGAHGKARDRLAGAAGIF